MWRARVLATSTRTIPLKTHVNLQPRRRDEAVDPSGTLRTFIVASLRPPSCCGHPLISTTPLNPHVVCSKPLTLVYLQHAYLSATRLSTLLPFAPQPRVTDCRDEAFNPTVTSRTFIVAALQPWLEHQQQPCAAVLRGLAKAGDIEGGTQALLAAGAVRTADFDDDVLSCLPPTPWRVTERDLAERRDLRCGGLVGWTGVS